MANTRISSETGIDKVQDGTITQADLATNVVGNGPAFIASQTTAQAFAQNSAVKVLLQQVDYDTGGNFSSSRFTATIAGYYQFNAAIYWTTSATATASLHCILYKGGVALRKTLSQVPSGAAMGCSGSWLVKLDVGEYVEFWATQAAVTSASTMVARPDMTYFSGCLVGVA